MAYDIGHEPSLDPPEPKAKLICDCCGDPIYEGEPYYRLQGGIVCERCLDNWKEIA